MSNIPIELEKDAGRFSLGLPTEPELSRLAATTIRDLAGKYRLKNDLGPERMTALVRSLLGLTVDEARRILTQSILEKSCLNAETIDTVREARGLLVKDQSVNCV